MSLFKFTWVNISSGNVDTTTKAFASFGAAGRHAAQEERKDRVWRCVSIERED